MIGGDGYCEFCGVTVDLHPRPDEESDDNCDDAIRKAEVLDRFWQPFAGRAAP